ncbi:phosducin-like protein [Varroa destructor]|uniref:Phosducin domain-containing protein n=1 Tax=Varroa destructor TaxID=109461 RepID=A0A7M7L6Q4_VARDE|nr:phosducin-like protein [Varroa destructor]XP_022671626.1 phosducin-like protein [Varroa destructor]
MASLEDKLLGEKLDYYCSSSEDEADEGGVKLVKDEDLKDKCPLTHGRWGAESTNTGPKGVLKDWQRYKQLESERRAEDEAERVALMKRLSLTCATESEERRMREKVAAEAENLEELDEMMLEYISQRMQEMVSAASHGDRPKFGKLQILRSSEFFLDAIDHEHKETTVFVHIYGPGSKGCDALNACLNTLAEEYPLYKFCVMSTEAAGMTSYFEKYGVPALVIYRGGNLIGNFVRLSDEFGDDFDSVEIESFLVDHGYLPDPSTVPKIVRENRENRNIKNTDHENDDDD